MTTCCSTGDTLSAWSDPLTSEPADQQLCWVRLTRFSPPTQLVYCDALHAFTRPGYGLVGISFPVPQDNSPLQRATALHNGYPEWTNGLGARIYYNTDASNYCTNLIEGDNPAQEGWQPVSASIFGTWEQYDGTLSQGLLVPTESLWPIWSISRWQAA